MVSDQLVVVAEPDPFCVLLEQHHVVLHRLGALLQLFKRCECIAGLVDRLEACAKGGDKGWVVGEWRCQGLHLFDDTCRPVGSVSF